MLSRGAERGRQKVQLIQGTGQEDWTGAGSLDVDVPCDVKHFYAQVIMPRLLSRAGIELQNQMWQG